MTLPVTNQYEMKYVCRNFMNGKCERDFCKFIHDEKLCVKYWKTASCKYGENCRKNHYVCKTDDGNGERVQRNRRKPKNTECYEPWTDPYEMRILYENSNVKLQKQLTSRDVLLVPNLFRDFQTGDIYDKLVSEIENCKVPKEELLKLWHGSEHLGIEGKHHICNDRTKWKEECPTFGMVIERLRNFFGVKVEATRMNWYKTSSEYKPRHHDAAAMDPKKAEKQNITIGVSFSKGDSRDIVFENVRSKRAICIPQGDGDIYTFGNTVNMDWKHGVNPGQESREDHGGRISIIIWGKI